MIDKLFGLVGIIVVSTVIVTVGLVMLILFLEIWEWINFKLAYHL